MDRVRQSSADDITLKDQIFAALGLAGIVFVWVLFLIPGAIWLIINLLMPPKLDPYDNT